jgi:Holliday junction DNA helicase RuvA
MAVVTGDDTALTRVKGLGKKGAQRIILELKDKLGHAFDGGARPEGTPAGAGNGMRAAAISALMVLGYSSAQATRAVDQVLDPSAGLEDTIKAALAHLLR